ncbi:MAG: hypothetical protein J5922_00130 [Clostridia bacterium]|nr:hypothetical protein [Clostridia bacterium]
MNWKKVTTFLIICLLAVNILLFFLLHFRTLKRNYIDGETQKNAVDIFERRGLIIDREIFSGKNPTFEMFGGVYDADAQIKKIEKIFGTDDLQSYNIPSNGKANIINDSAVFSFYPDFVIDYQTNDFAHKMPKDDAFFDNGFEEFEDKALQKEVSKQLSKLLVGDGEGKLSYEFGKSYRSKDGIAYIEIFQTANGDLIQNAKLTVCVENKTVKAFDGRWIWLDFTDSYKVNTLDRINILFYAQPNDKNIAKRELLAEKCTYCIVWDVSSNFYIKPCWQIEFSDGTSEIYDAATGDRMGSV